MLGQTKQNDGPNFPIVGIGASAGGLGALRTLLPALRPGSGAAYVLVQHLSPDQPSSLADVLQRWIRLPVIKAEDGIELRPDHLYVIQPDTDVRVEGDRLRVRTPRQPHSIDRFLHSLGAAQGERAVGILLSGADSDGTDGLRAIHEAGGLTMVQEPASAEFALMPQSAIAAGVADRVLAPAAMSEALRDHLAPAARRCAGPEKNGPEKDGPQVSAIPRRGLGGAPCSAHQRRMAQRSQTGARPRPADLAQQALLARFAPPAVLVDERFQVLYFHGATARYLLQPAGEPTRHLLDIAREGLRAPLCAAVRRAVEESIPVEAEGFLEADEGARRVVQVSVTPVAAPQGSETCFLISFSETAEAGLGEAEETGPARLAPQDLEAAVQAARSELRRATAEAEAAHEELHVVREELEAARAEIMVQNEELAALESSAIALLSLDAELHIRAFTPALLSLLGVRASDIGRPVGELAPKFHDADFEADSARVLATGDTAEREIQGQDGRWYLRRILPHHDVEGRMDGVVVVFLDITAHRRAEEELRAAAGLAQRIIATSGQPLLVLDPERRVRLASPAFCASFQLAASEVEGRSLPAIGEGEWNIPELERLVDRMQDEEDDAHQTEVEHHVVGLGRRCLRINVRRLDDAGRLLLTIADLTEQKDAEHRQQVLLTELQHRVKNILANVSAMIDLTRQRSTSLDAFVAALEGRLRAMSRIQDLLTQRKHEPVYLRDLLLGELEAQGIAGNTPDISIEGPDLHLDPRTAQGLGMAFHELTTNAVKYGAFTSGGRTDISWTVIRAESGPHLLFRWRESGLRMPAAMPQKGFGAELIEASIPYMLHGTARLDFRSDGVRCIIDIPMAGGSLSSVGEPAEQDLA